VDRVSRVALAMVAALGVLGCPQKKEVPVCGLHSAAAPLVMKVGKKERFVSVGARLLPSDRVTATGEALIECFGGALRRIEKGDAFEVGELLEAKIESTNIPRYRLVEGKLEKLHAMPRAVAPRYSDNQFTPESALAAPDPTSGDYLVAFFTPNGFAKMKGPPVEGPRNLPPPNRRPRVPFVHAGELGEGPYLITVEDEIVFAETDDLATAALPDDRTYSLGRTVRLILPDGAEATLELGSGNTLELEGPMDLGLR
jgi:hypothetical protein